MSEQRMQPLNVGDGDEHQRLTRLIWNVVNDIPVVTRWVCAEILARKIHSNALEKPSRALISTE